MKKKIRNLLLTGIVSASLLVSGCDLFVKQEKSLEEKQQEIYKLAQESGFTGTYEEWLESVKGAKGDKGDKGEKGEKGDTGNDGITPQIRINSKTNYWEISTDNGQTWTSTGVKATGSQGEKGDKPVIEVGSNGNWFVDGEDTTIKAEGDKGADGATWHTGEQAPASTLGENGDFYYDSVSLKIYYKNNI